MNVSLQFPMSSLQFRRNSPPYNTSMVINPAMMMTKKIIPIFRPNFLVPRNNAIKNLKIVLEIAARVIAVTAVVGGIVSGANKAILMVIASTSATPEIILAR